MVSTVLLAFSLAAPGQYATAAPGHHHHGPAAARVTPPGPGYGWGFPNGNPDGYGWVDYGTTIALGADRTPDYFFRRQYALPVHEMFFPTYYNPYLTRGQRYLPWAGCGGAHPAGGPPLGAATMPRYPSQSIERTAPATRTPPVFSGRVGGAMEPAGGSGLIP